MSNKNHLDDTRLDLTKIRDRKHKWGMSIMLPEHVTMLRHFIEEQMKVPKPQLDEWDLEAIQNSIEIGMKRNVDVEIKTWKEGAFISLIGKITWVDLGKRVIEMEDVFKSFILQLDEIVDVTVLE